MFDTLDDSLLLAGMAAAHRDERIACARRILLAGRLVLRRTAGVDADDRTQWCIDNWEAVAAEVSAELGISRNRASSTMNYGFELLERLPRLGAAFAAGTVDFRVIIAAVFRTGLITDPELLSRIDTILARKAPTWNKLSQNRVAQLIDHYVSCIDPAAVRVAREAAEDRHIGFGDPHNGMVEFWGSLRTPDAAALEQTLNTLADSVCTTDPRTKAQRRADALAGLAGAAAALGCECGASDCPAAQAGPPDPVVIHVIAEAATLSGESQAPGYLPGYGTVPPAMLREIAKTAKLRPLNPSELSCPEGRYRPSAALAEYIRCRDMHCRFPGCDKPAEYCDIDHTIPWQSGGPTHPSNLGLLCRSHHLLKTFWTGPTGWAEKQSSDGTITWTSPSGRRYTTTPGGALFFPQLAASTGDITLEDRHAAPGAGRTLMMPTRKRSRAAERAARIQLERGHNETRWAEWERARAAWEEANPPPF
jgi:hypothetical protein